VTSSRRQGAPACPLCGSASCPLFGVPDWIEGKRLFFLRRCQSCGLAFLHPIPTEAERKAFRGSESHYYGLVDLNRNEIQREAERLLRRVEQFRQPPGELLEVGAGRGIVLEAAARRGWSVVGLESDPAACERLRQRGLRVVEADVLQALVPESAFDVAILQHVLEHSSQPEAFLRRVAQWLRPGGLLFVGTPNGAGLLARVRRERFNYWIPPEHVFHYSPRALRLLLERSGFEVLRLSSFFHRGRLANDLRDLRRHHPLLRRLPARLAGLVLRGLRLPLERLGEGTILEAIGRLPSR
jgi:SAM-dependent methyltransferase